MLHDYGDGCKSAAQHPSSGSSSMAEAHLRPLSHKALLLLLLLLLVVVYFPLRKNVVIQACLDKVLQPYLPHVITVWRSVLGEQCPELLSSREAPTGSHLACPRGGLVSWCFSFRAKGRDLSPSGKRWL